MGLTIPLATRHTKKQASPTLTFIGRLHILKGVEDAISAFGLIHRLKPSWRFWIIGDGEEDYLKLLKQRVQKLGLTPVTNFFGPVSQSRKFELLSRSHLLLVPSAHEGWGLVVSEAAFVGTPTVAFRSGALQESVQDGQTGVLVRHNTPAELAREAVALLEDRSRYRRLQRRGGIMAKRMSWDDTATAAMRVLQYEK
jgi:glycosyltransferase involved in cell wall biosynthesis